MQRIRGFEIVCDMLQPVNILALHQMHLKSPILPVKIYLFFDTTTLIIDVINVSFLDNIVRLLDTYDAPILPPPVPIEPLLVKKMSIAELKRNILRQMQNDFKKIDELSRIFHMNVQELSSLDATYKEMVGMLHENKSRQERREVRCGSLLSSKSCKGSVYVNIIVRYYFLNIFVFFFNSVNLFFLHNFLNEFR